MYASLPESGCLRKLDHDTIDTVLDIRRRWINGRSDYYQGRRQITDDMVDNLHTLCDTLLITQHQYKLVAGGGCMRVYTTDTALFAEILSAVPSLVNVLFSRAVINRPRNTIKLKDPVHTERSYLREIKLTDQQKKSIGTFLKNQESIRLSPSLASWLVRSGSPWSQGHHFVDHNDTAWLTMLSLIRPGLIKNTIKIIPA
jgi:hypothetical protein